jgi:hypothetical protein
MKYAEVIEWLDRMFSGDTQSFEVRASDWRTVRAHIKDLEERLALVPDDELRNLLAGSEQAHPNSKLCRLLRELANRRAVTS